MPRPRLALLVVDDIRRLRPDVVMALREVALQLEREERSAAGHQVRRVAAVAHRPERSVAAREATAVEARHVGDGHLDRPPPGPGPLALDATAVIDRGPLQRQRPARQRDLAHDPRAGRDAIAARGLGAHARPTAARGAALL